MDEALVAGKAESVQKRLAQLHLKGGIQFGIDCEIRAVVGGAETGVVDLQVGAERKVLLVQRLDLDVVYLIELDSDLRNVRLRGDGVLHIAEEAEEGVERGNGRAGAERGGDEAAVASGRTRGCGATTAPRGAKAARRGRDDAGVDAEGVASSLGALKIGSRDGEVVAEGGEREIIFERQSDRVPQGDAELAVLNEVVEAP